jgi:pyruvate dehydrogenase E1 component alpha subunit
MLSEMGVVNAPLYLSSGSEAIIAAMAALAEDDIIFSGHRNAAIMVGCECEVEDMFLELLGDKHSSLAGRSGLGTYSDSEVNFYGSTLIPSSQFSVAVGCAMAKKLQGEDSIVICFAGDGATCDGSFYEALNMASVYELPIIFFIENNGYAGKMKTSGVIDTENIASRANGFDVTAVVVNGSDPMEVYQAVDAAIDYVLDNRPVIIEAKTNVMYASRYGENSSYREDNEVSAALENKPVEKFEKYLLEKGVLNQLKVNLLIEKAKEKVDEAYNRALYAAGIEIKESEVV